ncbi:MAG: ATP-grasp domain-containing protein [Halobacteriovoraceae bacterium]|jgi:5-(carboxyamino)imidazole ribonucleotide synthase|nr:ATP-grasp domain-containing protein [Halobacteriovoraceae bacterium]
MQKKTSKSHIIGILGGGQLALMLMDSAVKKGHEVVIYAQNLDEPACQKAKRSVIGSQTDQEQLLAFFRCVDSVVLESEFYSPELLEFLVSKTKTKILPSLSAYKHLYAKNRQKTFFKQAGIAFVNSVVVSTEQDLELVDFSAPYMLKLSHGGYDGYGNLVVENAKDLKAKVCEFSDNYSQNIIIEQLIQIKSEYASMLVKGRKDNLIFPTCKTYQENSICHLVEFPAPIGEKQASKISKFMQKINHSLDGEGVFAFEFFEDDRGDIYVNECAPRVHNSYHFTMENFEQSQFDYMIDIAVDEKISAVSVLHSHGTMINLLGQKNSSTYKLIIPETSSKQVYAEHMYLKKQNKIGRKMGHLTLYGDQSSLEIAKKIKKEYKL